MLPFSGVCKLEILASFHLLVCWEMLMYINKLKWTICSGTGGRFESEWVDDLEWNQWTIWAGIRS